MKTLLAINSSPMIRTAVTRRLVAAFVSLWSDKFPGGRVIHRDLGTSPPPHPDERTLAAFAKDPGVLSAEDERALALSDQFVGELVSADHVVIGSPMYNFTVTSGLKAWIDLVGRPGKTFEYTENGPRGLLAGKRVFILTARGGYYARDGQEDGMDFQEQYLRGYFQFLGIDQVQFVHAEGQGIDRETARREEAAATRCLKDLVSNDHILQVA